MSAEGAVRDLIKLNGEPFDVTRSNQVVATVSGSQNRREQHVTFLPGIDLREGDVLRATTTGKTFHVTEVDPYTLEGKVYRVTATYETEAQRAQSEAAERRQPGNLHIGHLAAQNAVIGYQQHANISTTTTATVTLSDIEHYVAQQEGPDAEELRTMLAELKPLLNERGSLSKGGLAQFSQAIEGHSWIAGALAQVLLNWALGNIK